MTSNSTLYLVGLVAHCSSSTFVFQVTSSTYTFGTCEHVQFPIARKPTCTCWTYTFRSRCKHIDFVCNELLCLDRLGWKLSTMTVYGGYATMAEAYVNIFLPRQEILLSHLHNKSICTQTLLKANAHDHLPSEPDQCIICLEEDKAVKAKCDVCSCLVHKTCWGQWIIHKHSHVRSTCPQCRSKFYTDDSLILDCKKQFSGGRTVVIVSKDTF